MPTGRLSSLPSLGLRPVSKVTRWVHSGVMGEFLVDYKVTFTTLATGTAPSSSVGIIGKRIDSCCVAMARSHVMGKRMLSAGHRPLTNTAIVFFTDPVRGAATRSNDFTVGKTGGSIRLCICCPKGGVIGEVLTLSRASVRMIVRGRMRGTATVHHPTRTAQ